MAVVVDGVLDKEAKPELKKYKVSSNRPELLGAAGNDVEYEAVDATDALSQFVKANGLTSKTSVHKFKVVAVEPEEKPKKDVQVSKPKPPTVKKKSSQKDE